MKWSLLLIMSLLLLCPPSKVTAAEPAPNPGSFPGWSCDKEPQYIGAGLPYTTDNLADDCSICPEGSQCWWRWFNGFTVKDVDNPTLMPHLIGDPNKTQLIDRNGGGQSSEISANTNANWAYENKLKLEHPELFQFGPALALYEAARPNRYDAECLNMNQPLSECYRGLPGTSLELENRSVKNSLVTSTPRQRLRNPKSWFENELKTMARQHLACRNNPDQPFPCNPKWKLPSGKTSYELAGEILQIDDFTAYQKLPIEKQRELAAFDNTNTSSMFYVVVFPDLPDIANTYAAGDTVASYYQSKYYEITWNKNELIGHFALGALPGTPTAADWEKKYNQYLNPPAKNGLNAARQNTVTAAAEATNPQVLAETTSNGIVNPLIIKNTANPYHRALLNKINASGTQCNTTSHPEQFLGSLASSRSPQGGSLLLKWRFLIDAISKLLPENIKPMEKLYRVCFLQPAEIATIDSLSTTSPNSSSRALYTPRYGGYFGKQNNSMPMPFASSPNAKTDPATYADYNDMELCYPDIPENEQRCPKNKPIGYEFTAGAPRADIDGNKPQISKLCIEQGKIHPPNDPNQFNTSTPYAIQADFRARNANVPLSTLIGFSTSSPFMPPKLPDCPQEIPGKPSLLADVCAVAAKHAIPCEFLTFILLTESGLTPETLSNYDANACVCPSGGESWKGCGPMQINQGAFEAVTTDAEATTLDRCQPADALELTARVLLWKKNPYSFDPSNPDAGGGMTIEGNLNDLGEYAGSSQCQPTPEQTRRWGPNYSYCDAFRDWMAGKPWPNPNHSPAIPATPQ